MLMFSVWIWRLSSVGVDASGQILVRKNVVLTAVLLNMGKGAGPPTSCEKRALTWLEWTLTYNRNLSLIINILCLFTYLRHVPPAARIAARAAGGTNRTAGAGGTYRSVIETPLAVRIVPLAVWIVPLAVRTAGGTISGTYRYTILRVKQLHLAYRAAGGMYRWRYEPYVPPFYGSDTLLTYINVL